MTVLILGMMIGFMIFFPLVIAPTIFRTLSEEQAGKILRIFFPKYYLFGIVLSVIGLGSSYYQADNISLLSFIFLFITFTYSRQILMPAINKAKDDFSEKNEIAKLQFNRLHMFSVLINFIQLILCLCLILNLFFFKLQF